MYGYYNRHEEEDGNLVGKLDGLAKLAGIIGLGVASRPYWSRLAGKAAVTIGENLPGKLTGRTAMSAVEGGIIGEEIAVPFFQFPDAIRKAVANVVVRHKRINFALDTLGDQVDDATKEIFEANKADFRTAASIFGKVGSVEETDVENIVLNPRAIRKLTSMMEERGIKFKEGFYKSQRRIFNDIVRKTAGMEPDPVAIEEYLSNKENQEQIRRAFQSVVAKQNRRVNVLKKFINLGSNYEEITGAHLLDEGGTNYNAVNQYLKKIGIEGEDPVRELVQQAQKLHRDNLIRLPDNTTPQEEAAALEQSFTQFFRQSTTGLVKDKKSGKVFSLARVREERRKYGETLLDELQIPLVPFAVGVPLKTFKFMRPTDQIIRSLGTIGHEPELRREFLQKGYSSAQLGTLQGMGIDDSLLTFSEDGKITFHETDFKRIVSYERRKNKNIATQAALRDLEANTPLENARDFSGSEQFSAFQRIAMKKIPKVTTLKYDAERGGFTISPNSTSPLTKLYIKAVYGTNDGIVDVQSIHPSQLAEFIQGAGPEEFEKMDPFHIQEALTHIIDQMSSERTNLAPYFKSVDKNTLPSTAKPELQFLYRMMDHADDPNKLVEILRELEARDPRLYGQVSPSLYRSLQVFTKDPGELYATEQGESGALSTIISNIYGHHGLSAGREKMHEAILSQVLREQSIEVLGKELGSQAGIRDALVQLKEQLTNADPFENLSALRRRFLNIQLTDMNLKMTEDGPIYEPITDGAAVEALINSIIDPKKGNEEISREALGAFAIASMSHTERTNMLLSTNDLKVKAKIAKEIATALNSMESLNTDQGIYGQLTILREMMDTVNATEILSNRFTATKPFVPLELGPSPLNAEDFYTTVSSTPSMAEIFQYPGQIGQLLKHQWNRNFGMSEFIQGMTMPDRALGSFGAAVQMLISMPQNIAADIGLGLSNQSRITALRTMGGMYAKRVLPLIIGQEVYKNYNANMHYMGLSGLDDMSANLIANVNLNAATLKDTLGVTSFNQWAVSTFPGLDQYASPRSREEYEEYLKYGNEEVRQSRGWLHGARSAFMGESIKYMRPNFFRRWKSHWTEASNVDISNPYYSFLPNLQNPLAPLSLLTNPDWWVEKHRNDRPYIPGGSGRSSTQWASKHDYLTINSVGNYGPLAIGEIGGGYPIAMTGGGAPVSYDLRTESLVTGSQGTGGAASYTPMGAGMSMGVYSGAYQQHTFGLEAAGDPIRIGLHKGSGGNNLASFSIPDLVMEGIKAVRTQSGLYGAVMSRLPIYPEENFGLRMQDPRAARSFSRQMWMSEFGELPLGPIGTAKEFFRRYVTPDTQGYDAWNPLPNNMPSWLPEKFQTGDPYMRVPGIGELQLPGEAWERTHPWVAPMKVRGSAIGLSEKEIIQKWLNPLEEMEDQDAQDIVDFGSAVHLQVQRQLRQIGALVGAEVSIYDKENNLSGTIDAIARSSAGLEILEIKTQGSRSWGSVPDKYIEQLNFYMANTGINKGKIVFINRDDPQQVRLVEHEFDPYMWQSTLNKVQAARQTMSALVDQGLVSPFETYDLVSRIEILSKAAPNSPEFRAHVEHALGGGLGGFEKQRVKQAIEEAQNQGESYNLYSRRNGVDLATAYSEVLGIGKSGEIITENGVLTLAGVDFDQQAFSFDDPEGVLSRYGINVGDNIRYQLMRGALNPEVMEDVETPVIIGDVNSRLVDDGYANWSSDTERDPVASQARYGNSVVGGLWENFVHSDGLIQNKFLRVRTALEQFERGEVFGTDDAKWNDPINTFLKPTIASIANKDPISSSIQGAVVAAMFARTNAPQSRIPYLRSKLAIGGAAIGATLSTLRMLSDFTKSDTWTPRAYRHKAAHDEYWDILKYLKYSSIAESSKKMALYKEKINIDKLKDSERQTVGLGPYAAIAIDAERKAKRTMYGFNIASGSLQDAIQAIPKRQQQIALEIVQNGTLEEKQRFYDLLPDAQRRVLGKFLGVKTNELPSRQVLTEYFKSHFLPNVDWAGWSATTDMNDMQTRSAAMEGVKVDKPNRAKVQKARAMSNNSPVPRMDNPTYGNIRRQINNLLSSGGYHNISVDLKMLPADESVVNVNMELFDDETDSLLEHYRNEL